MFLIEKMRKQDVSWVHQKTIINCLNQSFMKVEHPDLLLLSEEEGEEIINRIKAAGIPQAEKDIVIRILQINVQLTPELSRAKPRKSYLKKLLREMPVPPSISHQYPSSQQAFYTEHIQNNASDSVE